MMKKRIKQWNNRGFTLMEMVAVIAIVVILFAVAVIPISKMRQEIRQTELDSRAELIFMAAQNELTQLQAAGRSEAYATGATPMGRIPMDAEDGKYEKDDLVYITSAEKWNGTSAAAFVLPQGKVEQELWNANWVVEYDAKSGSVYAVFYSEKEIDYTPEGVDSLRYRNQRIKNGAVIGYYGGDSVGAYETGMLEPEVTAVNGEQLYIQTVCDTQAGAALQFTVTLEDEEGHRTEEIVLKKVNGEVEQFGRTYTATLMLDDLTEEEGMRFAEQERFKMLVPGQDLTVVVKVTSDSDLLDEAVITLPEKVNSLFAEVRREDEERTAVITSARHLQNLDKASGVNTGTGMVTAALQEQDIQFSSAAEDSWTALYGTLSFQPIQNEKLRRYDSTFVVGGASYHPVIYDLPIDAKTGDAGLFAALSDAELQHIRLAGAKIAGSGNVGGIVGAVKGKVTMDGCQVFLSPSKGHTTGTEKDIWISGKTTGGLAGVVSGQLTVKNSFAATVLDGTAAAGGFVGSVQGNVSAEKSYADCYVYSTDGAAGGFVGTRRDGKMTFQNCYSAGFLEGKTLAGLSAGALRSGDTLKNVYTACAFLGESEKTYAIAPAAASMPSMSKVYYLMDAENGITGAEKANYADWSGENRKTAAKNLGTAFTGENSDTYAYNLKEGLGLSLYSYPKLAGLPHYGDWQAEFESGSLIYYEAYKGGSYGFYGANVSTLSNTLDVLGDGYGMVYEGTAPDTVEVTYKGHPAVTLYGKDALQIQTVIKGEKKTYALLALPADMVQNTEIGDSFYHKLTVDGKTYFYHPHFANTAVAGEEPPEAPEQISVRTARHLYALSESYEAYTKQLAEKTTFLQGRNIAYRVYDWAKFGKNGTEVKKQHPIGQSEKVPFTYAYNGGYYTITGVSLVTDAKGTYAGLFGYQTGDLRNIVLTSEEAMNSKNAVSVSIEGVIQRKTAYMGMLAGYNEGTIYNCAASGYQMQNNAYSGSTVYVGGLVGYNDGAIRSSSASAPDISGSSTYAKLYAGGFTGGNGGQIRQCYTMANIEILPIRGGGVTISGFSASNAGSIRESYCATALTSAGALTYGFAQGSGSVTNCYYLNGGTYSFVGKVRLYEFEPGNLNAKPVTDEELMALSLRGFDTVGATDTFCYPNTAGTEYPYPGSVTGRSNASVHYGDWATKADLGKLGMIYWEKEEGGTNDGYHFSFIGFDNRVKKIGSSLCTAHDDGGTIAAYGYGYYWKDEEAAVTLTADSDFRLDGKTEAAAAALRGQVPGYQFVAYETGDTGLRLLSVSKANATWTLRQNGTTTYTYQVCPFFADAYGYQEAVATGSVDPGSKTLPYQVRSVEQLQYINWSVEGGVGSATRDVTDSNYKYFPYLQYTSATWQAQQTKANALKGDTVGGARPIRYWQQSHDLNGADLNAPNDPLKNQTFQPIAGAVYSNATDNYSMLLYNWFGSEYDGQDYYIKNINIDSYCYNVGVFGTTAGADIQNIVLYSDNQAVIRRSSDPTSWNDQRRKPASKKEYQCSYALGGLIGIAYDYKGDMGNGTVSNCAMAGYVIADNSRNLLALGEAAVGGLIGVSSVNLENCSAVADIQINCTHRWKNDGSLNSAKYGNFVRVGGLVGGLRYTATNCYTGGSITIGEETLKERILYGDSTNQNFQDGSTASRVKWSSDRDAGGQNQSPATYVYIGGIGGSGFSANFMNFSNKNGSDDGTPTFNNCYTYIDLPDMQGTITGISLIGSVADRYGYWSTAKVNINNCYYLDSTKAGISFDKTAKYYYPAKESLANILSTQAAKDEMLNGNMDYLQRYVWENLKNERKHTIKGLTELTYAQMSDRIGRDGLIRTTNGSNSSYPTFKDALGDGFGWVTIEEQGASIHGKYSFPGDDTALQGQDYPFPTVLTQVDSFGSTVNLHYGGWPKVGLFWSEGIATLDMIADYREDTKQSAIDLVLKLDNVANKDTLGDPTFAYANENVVEAAATRRPDGDFDVVLKGLAPGATEVTATVGTYTARLMITVTADLTATVEPGIVEEAIGESAEVTFKAADRNGKPLKAVWQIVNEDESIATHTATTILPDGTAKTTITGVSSGETSLNVLATCTLSNGMAFEGTTVLNIIIQEPVTPPTDAPITPAGEMEAVLPEELGLAEDEI